jgi:hypothetical protein
MVFIGREFTESFRFMVISRESGFVYRVFYSLGKPITPHLSRNGGIVNGAQ